MRIFACSQQNLDRTGGVVSGAFPGRYNSPEMRILIQPAPERSPEPWNNLSGEMDLKLGQKILKPHA